MKHLLLILAVVATAGCTKKHRPLITGKEPEKDGLCSYWYTGLDQYGENIFKEPCNKYNIGDTIK